MAIWVDRTETTSRAMALRKAKRILDAGGNIILFPLGMRDYHAESLGELFDGAAWLVIHCQDVKVVPFGTKGYANFMPNDRFPFPRFWAKREIKVGEPLKFSPSASVEEITREISKAILEQKNKG